MKIIQFAINKPVTVLVFFFFICLFGGLSIFNLPVQLTPNVDKPEISITTLWEGASPQEIEQEVVERQEEKLKSIQGLKKMTSTSTDSRGSVELEFFLETDMSRALLDVSEKLRQVKDYPLNVDQPIVRSGSSDQAKAIAWFVLKSDPPREDIEIEKELLEDLVKPYLERVPGVSSINIYGGKEREIHINIDPQKLASNNLALSEVRKALKNENKNISAGSIDQQKRSYIIRTVGQYETLDDIRDTVISRSNKGVIYLKDIGDAVFSYKKQKRIVRTAGYPTIAMNAIREAGTNVIKVMNGLQSNLAFINKNILGPKGMYMEQVYDETIYVHSSIDLVINNLWVGGILATLVLIAFLRSISSTFIIAVSIPISVVGTFLLMQAFGRNINVVSLAGMAFAVGIVVDNSIVVLENIYRHLQMGKEPFAAAMDATTEVWGAVLASTLTTIAVFVPILFVQEEAGQLFRDIAIALSSATALSLIVSIVFIPMASARILRIKPNNKTKKPLSVRFGNMFTNAIVSTVEAVNKTVLARVLVVGGFTTLAIWISFALAPPMTYLPSGNRNLVIGFLIPPPGYNTAEFIAIGKKIEKIILPYYHAELGSEEAKRLDAPPIENYFYVSTGQNVFMGLRSKDPKNVKPLIGLMQRATSQIPGLFAFASQRSLFGRGLSSGNSIDLEISGFDYDKIKAATLSLMPLITQKIGFPRPNPPNFNLGGNEIRMVLDRDKASEIGLNVDEAGFILRTMVDGSIIGDFRDKGKSIDLKLISSSKAVKNIEDIENIPVSVKNGKILPLGAFANFSRIEAPTQINHIEEKKAIKLIVSPPDGMELQTAMDILENDIITPLREKGVLPDEIETALAGTADKMVSARKSLQWNFLLSLLITYLLMSSLFESFLYPLIIMFSVPLSWVGGIIGLNIAHSITGQQMDIITMLGFIILVGTVVNNAILIVHQALNLIKDEGMEPKKAIAESVRTRIRPIFMSTTTSMLGMVPLVFFSGAGSELYKGLGSVVIGGLFVSTLFTLIVVPTCFSLALSVVGKRRLSKA